MPIKDQNKEFYNMQKDSSQISDILLLERINLLSPDFIFQLKSKWYQFTCLIRLLRKFSDFVYIELSKEQVNIFLKSPAPTSIKINYSIPLSSFDLYNYNLNKELFLCISLDDLIKVIERFKKQKISNFYFAYFGEKQKIALFIEKKTYYLNLLDYTPTEDELNFSFITHGYIFKFSLTSKDFIEILLDESIFSDILHISLNERDSTLQFYSNHEKCDAENLISLNFKDDDRSILKKEYSFNLIALSNFTKSKYLLPNITHQIELILQEDSLILSSSNKLGTFIYQQLTLENTPKDVSDDLEANLIQYSQLESNDFIKIFKDHSKTRKASKQKRGNKKYLVPKKKFSQKDFLNKFKDDRKRKPLYKETLFTRSGNVITSKVLKSDSRQRQKGFKEKKIKKKNKEKKIRNQQREEFKKII